jgi:F-type H+-transporting ATPase subunit a
VGEHGHSDPIDFQATHFIMEHVQDAHAWHFTDLPDGTPVSISLPWIVYSSEHGLITFTSHAHSRAELMDDLHERGLDMNPSTLQIQNLGGEGYVIDFSITKTVVQMLIVALLMIWIFVAVANGYKKRQGQAPKGIQNLMEPVIVFVRDDIAKPNLHGRHEKYMPYLLTAFFFIWFANLFGLTPLNVNVTGNISVTLALAFVTFLITQFSSNKHYWGHIFWFPGVPVPVKLIMIPVELIGVISKPFALMVRLFANITAGHFLVVSLVMMIFIVARLAGGGDAVNPGAGFGVGIASVAFTLFIMVIELLVAVLQAYVFTLLSAVFIGQAYEHSAEHH